MAAEEEQPELTYVNPYPNTAKAEQPATIINKEKTMADFLTEVINPDLARLLKDNPEFKEIAPIMLNKELKVSNLDKKNFDRIKWYNAAILLYWRFGVTEYATKLLIERDAYLSATSSIDSSERRLEVTGINIHKYTPLDSKSGLKDMIKLSRNKSGGE